MAKEKKVIQKQNRQTEEVCECLELMKNLTDAQKERVIGIMMGMRMYNEQLAIKSA